MPSKAEDADGLAPFKDDNTVRQKKDRKDKGIFKFVSYKTQEVLIIYGS